jgi:DNA-directed RNA polymerase specialized sigma24 family protein
MIGSPSPLSIVLSQGKPPSPHENSRGTAVTPSLIDQRPRGELIAELYDRHAAGLFAYCHDQLGDSTSAADALVTVLGDVPAVEPPRAALYALARREIYRRDVAYVFPSVDPAADPASALIERVVREVRPHQREVLLLSAVCGLDTVELAWVLDVAADTAEQLVVSARHRFTQSLAAAVSSARSAALVPGQVAEVYGGLALAPVEHALARLPWRAPSAALRLRILSEIPEDAGTVAAPARPDSKRLWPTTPRWPLPLAEPNPFTNTGVFPAKELSPPEPGRRSRHEASTEPMPKVRDQAPGSTAGLAMARRRSTMAAAPVPDDVLTEDPPAAPATPAAEQDTSSRGASPFSKALSAGQWPTLQRTFSVGRPPPATAPPSGQAEGSSGRSRRKTSARAAGKAAEAPGTDKKVAGTRTKVANKTVAGKGEDAAGTGSDKFGALAKLLAVASTAFTRKPAEPRLSKAAKPRTAEPTAPVELVELTERLEASPVSGEASTASPSLADDTPQAPAPSHRTATASVTEPATSGNLPSFSSLDSTASDAETTGPIDRMLFAVQRTTTADLTASPVDTTTSSGETAEVPVVPGQAPVVPRQAPAGRAVASRPRRHERPKPIKLGEHHYDWLWELAGFLVCVAIAMIVFFAVPTIVTP